MSNALKNEPLATLSDLELLLEAPHNQTSIKNLKDYIDSNVDIVNEFIISKLHPRAIFSLIDNKEFIYLILEHPATAGYACGLLHLSLSTIIQDEDFFSGIFLRSYELKPIQHIMGFIFSGGFDLSPLTLKPKIFESLKGFLEINIDTLKTYIQKSFDSETRYGLFYWRYNLSTTPSDTLVNKELLYFILEHEVTREVTLKAMDSCFDNFYVNEEYFTKISALGYEPNISTLENLAQDNVDLFKSVIEKLPDINKFYRSSGYEAGYTTLVNMVASNASPEAVKFLISKGADINQRDTHGLDALTSALNTPNDNTIETVNILLENGAKVDQFTVFKAIEFDSQHQGKILKIALKNGLDINKSFDQKMMDALKAEISLDMISKDLNEFLDSYSLGNTLLHRALLDRSYNKKYIKMLAELGADFNLPDATGKTPIHYFKDYKTIMFLVSLGADATATDAEGNTWLHTLKGLDVMKLEQKESEEFKKNVEGISDTKNNQGLDFVTSHLLKGHTELARKFYDLGFKSDANFLRFDLIDAVKMGLEHSGEGKKLQALLHLYEKEGIEIPVSLSSYINTPKKIFDEKINRLLDYEYIDQLVGKYLIKAEHKLRSELSPNKCVLELYRGITQFIKDAQNGKDTSKALEAIKSHALDASILKKVEDKFDAYYFIFSKVINLIEDSYNNEVMTINGWAPTHQFYHDHLAFRGFNNHFSEESAKYLFKYGHKAFVKTGYNYFSLEVREPWTQPETPSWQFSTTYVSKNPYMSLHFAKGWVSAFALKNTDKVLMEFKIPSYSPKICGHHASEYEFVMNRINPEELTHIYILSNNGDSIEKIIQNPYIDYASANLTPIFSIGANTTDDYIYGNTAENNFTKEYEALNCQAQYAKYDDYGYHKKYSSVEDFEDKYTSEEYTQSRAKVHALYELHADESVLPEEFLQ